MSDSILTTVKKLVGIDESYDAFDLDIITHINSALSTLNQLGIGPEEGFMIDDDMATWDQLLGDDNRLNSVKSLIGLKVRVVFDPPATSFTLDAFNKQIEELQWRLNVYREGRDHP